MIQLGLRFSKLKVWDLNSNLEVHLCLFGFFIFSVYVFSVSSFSIYIISG